jgi:hypothetical protein
VPSGGKKTVSFSPLLSGVAMGPDRVVGPVGLNVRVNFLSWEDPLLIGRKTR